MDVAEIDLLDRDRFTEGIPHEWFTWLRANAPVFHHDEPGGDGFWVITRYEDIVAANRDAASFSSAQDRGGVVSLEGPAAPIEGQEMAGEMMLFMDPPRHTRYRKLVNRGFTPRMIAALEEHLRDLTVRIVEDAIAKGDCDFVVDVAAELPLEVIAELLGVPREDRFKLFDWSNRMIGADDPEYRVAEDKVTEAQVEMFMYAQALAEQRRADPQPDIVTTLLNAEVDDDSLSEMDFNLFFMLLSVAGNETTRNAIAHGMQAFVEHPDQWALLVSDPDRYIGGAVEEILRWASPVLFFRRNCTPRHRARRRADPRGREDQPLVHLGQPRRVGVRRAVPVRHHPRPEPAHRLRGRRTALLPGGPARPARDQAAVRRAGRPGAGARGARRARPAAVELHRGHQAPPPPPHAGLTARAPITSARWPPRPSRRGRRP